MAFAPTGTNTMRCAVGLQEIESVLVQDIPVDSIMTTEAFKEILLPSPEFLESEEFQTKERLMMKLSGILLAIAVLLVLCSAILVAEFWAIRGPSGKPVVVLQKPVNDAMIVNGPFPMMAKVRVFVGPTPRGGVAAGPLPSASLVQYVK